MLILLCNFNIFVLSHCNFLTMFPTVYSSVANPQWQVVLASHVCAQLLGSTSTYYILITYHLSLCGHMQPTLVYLWCFSLSLSKITSVIVFQSCHRLSNRLPGLSGQGVTIICTPLSGWSGLNQDYKNETFFLYTLG